MKGRVAWAILLVASLATNAYLWSRDSTAAPASNKDHADRPQRSWLRRARPKIELAPEPVTIPQSFASLDRAELEWRLEIVEARVHDLLPLIERFDLDDRSPEVEARVKPYLERMFDVKPGAEPPYRFECHGNVCNIDSAVDPHGPLQSDGPEHAILHRIQFGLDGVFFDIVDPETTARRSLTLTIQKAAQPAMMLCVTANPAAAGELELGILVDPAERRMRLEAKGSLANESVGLCIRRAYETVIERTPIPPELNVPFLQWLRTLRLPMPSPPN